MIISKFLLIIKILTNVLFKRNLKCFFYEIFDLINIDFKYGSSTFVRKNNYKINYVPYYSLPFKKNLMKLQTHLNFKNTCFIDVGSGKGRILLAALDFNFKKIIGIEKNKFLYKESKKVFKNNNLNKRITVINEDLMKADLNFLKNLNLVVFWYGPQNKKILKNFLLKLKKKIIKKKIIFFLIPSTDFPKDLNFLNILHKNNDFKEYSYKDTNLKTRNSVIFELT
tara:strand:+ start:901 stop:1575 length:675 start_codon:yes stop_codon:yes gene_type:complete